MNYTKEMAVSEKVTKLSENMTRSQKNRQRKAKRSSKEANLPNLPPYRLSTILAGGSRHSSVLGAIRTLERLHPRSWLCDPSISEDARYEALLNKIASIDIGSDFQDSMLVLRSNETFRARSLLLLKNLRKLNLRAMLDHHCPSPPHDLLPASQEQVLSFLRALLHRIGLQDLVSVPQANITSTLKRLLEMTKGGHFTLAQLLKVLPSPRAIVPWFRGCPKLLRTHLGARLAVWSLVVLPRTILAGLFTITDSSHGKRHLYYYRQSVWQKLTARALHALQGRGLIRTKADIFVQATRESKSKKPPPPVIRAMRFIPKSCLNKVRPISMKKTEGTDPGLVKDSPLRELVRALVKLRPATCDLKGKRLAREWKRINRAVPTTAPLFWATADITDAFGSVLHKKLTRIVTEIAKDLICYPDARRLANEVCYRVVRHVVSFRVGGKIRYYHLNGRGLVQGDPLSPDLSSLYYGDFTATHLSAFLRPPMGQTEILLRAADDFLFVSTSRERVWQFQRATVAAEFPEYGARFSKDKWKSNVETGDQSTPALFCGALINMETRSVVPHFVPDVSPLAAIRPRPEGAKARPCIAAKFLRLCTVHMTDLYLGLHNSKAVIVATLAMNLKTALKRLTALLNTLIWKQGRKVDDGWLWKLVLQPAFTRVAKLVKRSRLSSSETNLVCLLSLRAAMKACPSFSPQLRAGVQSMLVKCRSKVGGDRDRDISKIVVQTNKK